MEHGWWKRFIGSNKQPYLSCPHCGNPVLALSERAALYRPHSRKCTYCHNRYRIPSWCHYLQIGGALLFVFIAAYWKFFFVFGEKPAYIIDALIATAISNIIGARLAFVAPLQKDEYTGTAARHRVD